MDKTEFIRSADFEMDEEFDLDSLIETHGKAAQVSTAKSKDVLNDPNIKGIVVDDADDLLSELGL
jgi:F420-dependent methylenetetrahydromethanopterin dehydrogenase